MPVQPIHYSHKIHAGANQIECKYCHSSARVSKHSGIPSLNVYELPPKHSRVQRRRRFRKWVYQEFYTKEIKNSTAVGWDEKINSTQATRASKMGTHPQPADFGTSITQHVQVGQIECQTCHGPVKVIMYQYSPLTMGWCINCHRETNVVENNEYYAKIHEALSKKYGLKNSQPLKWEV